MWTNEAWFRDADLWTRQGWYRGAKDLAARNAGVIRGMAQLLFDNIRTNLPGATHDDVVRLLETSNRQRLNAVPSLSKYPELRGMRELVEAMWRGWRDGAELDAARWAALCDGQFYYHRVIATGRGGPVGCS